MEWIPGGKSDAPPPGSRASYARVRVQRRGKGWSARLWGRIAAMRHRTRAVRVSIPTLLPALRGTWRAARLAAASLLVAGVSWAAEPVFDVVEIPTEGRTVAAELVDLDGDGRVDLLQIVFVSVPPDEQRLLRVFLQGPGGFRTAPDRVLPLPQGSAVYDLADVLPEPGTELLLLRARDLVVLSLGGARPSERHIAIPNLVTLGAAPDERGIDRLRIVWNGLGDGPWLMVPGPGEMIALSPSGELVARFEIGLRANYFVPRREGPMAVESEMQLFFDVPRLHVGDVNGDGRVDLIAASRHELRVFLRGEDGTFTSAPQRVVPIARVSEQDHIRGSGAIRVDVTEIDGDGRVDVLVSQVSGSLLDARTETSVHLNRDGAWDLASADQSFENRDAWTAEQLVDLDADGRLDLVRISVHFSILEVVEALIQQAIDAEVRIYRPDSDGTFGSEPWVSRKFAIPLDFETGRPRGFIPTFEGDVNSDGYPDLLASGDGDALEVWLGGPEHRYRKRVANQELDTSGRIRFGDLRGDGLADFVIFAPERPGHAVRIGRNRGILPGSPATMSDVAAPPPLRAE